MNQAPEYLTTSAAARLGRVTAATIRAWVARYDAISRTWTAGGHLRIEREPFERWLERQRQERARRRRGA